MSQEKYIELPLIPATPVNRSGPQQQSFRETAENIAVPNDAFLSNLMIAIPNSFLFLHWSNHHL